MGLVMNNIKLVKIVFLVSITLFICNFLMSVDLPSAINKIKQLNPTLLISEPGSIQSLKFGPNNQLLAILENEAIIWNNINDSKSIKTLRHESINDSLFGINSNIIATISKKGLVKIWDWKNADVKNQQKGISSTISLNSPLDSIVFYDKDKILVAMGNSIQLINIYNGSKVQENILSTNYLSSITISSDGKKIAFCTDEGIKVLSIPGLESEVLSTEGHDCDELKFSKDGNFIALASRNSKIKIWNLQNKKLVNTLDTFQNAALIDLVFSTDNKFLVVATENDVKVWDLANNSSRNIENRYKIKATKISAIALSPSNNKIAVGDKEGYVKIFDLKSGALIKNFDAGKKINDLVFDEGGSILATASTDGKIYVLNF